ncbi:MAG TPA: hypothetical protein VGW74_18870 [Propionibacteriaceae bacterium]|nr:hypothetical protein [Propionibacteriaceae bacterium]
MTHHDLTPLWVDQVVVERALAGKPAGRAFHRAERVEIARRVTAAGGGFNRLMRILGCSGDVAQRLISEACGPTGRVVSP